MAVIANPSKPPSVEPTRHEQPTSATSDDPFDRERLANCRPPNWKNPIAASPYDLIVIGGGPAGAAAAHEAAGLGARTALIERNLIGGNRLNFGCVPSKSLIRTSRYYADLSASEQFGASPLGSVDVDFARAMERMREIRARLSRQGSAQRLTEAGVDVLFGDARFIGADHVAVAGQALRFRKALIATGARPLAPSIPGLADAGYLTNESFFDLTARPARLLVIGGGPLGCEAAQMMQRLGAEVTLAEHDPMFLSGEERDAAQLLSTALERDGVHLRLNTDVIAVRSEGGQKRADLLSAGETSTVAVDQILVGVGRAPNVKDLNLEVAGVDYDAVTGVIVDDCLRTTNPRIFAAGDVCLRQKFTHTAEASASLAVRNALLRGRGRMSALTIPWCTYTDPEIAHVGLYVREAMERGIPIRSFTILMQDVDRAVADGEDIGFVKIHIEQDSDRILGATLVARHAGEMIFGISLAISAGIGLSKLARVVHAYPTQVEAIKMAANAYRRSRQEPSSRPAAVGAARAEAQSLA